MSLPEEKARSVKYTKEWLTSLREDKKFSPITGEVRQKAHRLTRHFPLPMNAEELPRKQAGVLKATYKWLFKLLDRRHKVRIGELRSKAASLLKDWPDDEMVEKTSLKW